MLITAVPRVDSEIPAVTDRELANYWATLANERLGQILALEDENFKLKKQLQELVSDIRSRVDLVDT